MESTILSNSGNQTSGQAVLRLLQFAEQLSPGEQVNSIPRKKKLLMIEKETDNFFLYKATDRSFWDIFVQDFFIAGSTLKMVLLNTETNKRKSFGKEKKERKKKRLCF